MEKEPDYRFSLANERTFLAWIRTALAVLAGGMLFYQFAARIEPRWLVDAVAIGSSIVGGLVAVAAYCGWCVNQAAMRREQPLPRSLLLPAMAAFSVTVCGVAVLLLLSQA
ncbi:YidH family protein [Variovorax paradoxus]|nr:DUF202 domain-containing protein [Variovorax paradoxus]